MNRMVQKNKRYPSERDIFRLDVHRPHKTEQCFLTGFSFSAAIVTDRPNAYVKLLGNLLIGQSGFLDTAAEKIGQFGIFLTIRFHISNLLAFAVAWPKVATDMIPQEFYKVNLKELSRKNRAEAVPCFL